MTWAYAIVVWLVADLAKVVTQKLFRSQAKIKEACKQDETKPPTWVRIVDISGTWAEEAADKIESGLSVRLTQSNFHHDMLQTMCKG